MTLKEPKFGLTIFLFAGLLCWLAADARTADTTTGRAGSGESSDQSANSPTGSPPTGTTFSSAAPIGSAPTGSPPSGSSPTPSTTISSAGTALTTPATDLSTPAAGPAPSDNSVVVLTDNDAIGNSAFRPASNPVAGVNRPTVLDTGLPEAAPDSMNAQLETRVMETLTADGAFSTLPVNAEVRSGVLRLTGTVSTAAEKQRAGELAARTEGIIRIDNDIVVDTDTDTVANVLVST